MSLGDYDKNSVASIYEYSLRLTGKSLSNVVDLPREVMNSRNRGDLGSLIERYFFRHVPPNTHEPDFAEVGLELKTTGVLKKSGKYRAKERLVLTKINYKEIVLESWEKSTLYKKCNLMLILFYLYSKEVEVIDRKFVIGPLLYNITNEDFITIKNDWEFIKKKILDGKAHELSEGDTFYLGACRKGSGGEKEALQTQPYSTIRAKARAFSFKQGYLNQLIEAHSHGKSTADNFRPLSKAILEISEKTTFEQATYKRFKPFIGMTLKEIFTKLEIKQKPRQGKSYLREIASQILANGGSSVPELVKAGIEMKTIRLTVSGKPREAMSFPGFKFLEIINEKWEDSNFYEKLEHKFLFIIFREDLNGDDRFMGAFYWNMPYEDRLEAKKVWEETKKRVQIDATKLPKSGENRVAHVRPKGRDGQDKIMTPQGDFYLKQCFWLNQKYVAQIVEANLFN